MHKLGVKMLIIYMSDCVFLYLFSMLSIWLSAQYYLFIYVPIHQTMRVCLLFQFAHLSVYESIIIYLSNLIVFASLVSLLMHICLYFLLPSIRTLVRKQLWLSDLPAGNCVFQK